MKHLFTIVLSAVLLFISPIMRAEEAISRKDFIKNMVELLELQSELSANPAAQDYIVLLNKKGFDITSDNLDTPISADERSVLINKLIRFKLEKRAKTPEGIANKAIVDEVNGQVLVQREGQQNWVKAEKGMQLDIGDIIKTGISSYINLRAGRFGRITISENSRLSLKEISYTKERDTENIILNLAMGEAILDARDIKKGSRFAVETPTTVAAVRGTVYSVKIINEGKMTRCE